MPSSFKYVVTDCETDSESKWTATVRADICAKQEAIDWLSEFEQTNCLDFRVLKTKKENSSKLVIKVRLAFFFPSVNLYYLVLYFSICACSENTDVTTGLIPEIMERYHLKIQKQRKYTLELIQVIMNFQMGKNEFFLTKTLTALLL